MSYYTVWTVLIVIVTGRKCLYVNCRQNEVGVMFTGRRDDRTIEILRPDEDR